MAHEIRIEGGDPGADMSAGSTEFVAVAPRESLKSVFYMLAGKPDSILKVFTRPIVVSFEDLVELNDEICDKLRNYQQEGVVATVDITYDNNITKQFGTWQEFQEHKWTGPEVTQALSMKWDFLVKLPLYHLPQRHTLSVRIASIVRPAEMFQYLLSTDPEELDRFEFDSAPVSCRIDFINHRLSQELVQIIEQWNKARGQADVHTSLYTKLKKHCTAVERSLQYAFPITVTFVAASVLWTLTRDLDPNASVSLGGMRLLMWWLLASGVSIVLANEVSKWLAGRVRSAIENYGRYTVFEMTRGDKNKKDELTQSNQRTAQRFFINCGVALALNLIAAVIGAFLFGQ